MKSSVNTVIMHKILIIIIKGHAAIPGENPYSILIYCLAGIGGRELSLAV